MDEFNANSAFAFEISASSAIAAISSALFK
jgi:hypothetical protein